MSILRPVLRPVLGPVLRRVTDAPLGTLAGAVRALFANNEQGAWYDPSDLSTMYQDAAGTTPVTAVEQPVGLVLDKSGRGNHATQATSAARPVLKQDSGGRYYLNFDGVDDSLSTGSIDFTSTDKMTVWAGVHKASDAATAMLAELSADAGTTAGSWYLTAPSAAGTYVYFSRGATAGATATASGFAAPVTSVLCAIGDIAADQCIVRVDGVQAASSAADQTAGNYTSRPLYMGMRGGTSIPFNGRIYGLVIRGAASTASQIASGERFMASKSGVQLA